HAFVATDPEGVGLAPLLTALDQLSSEDAELIRLIAWEDLTPAEAGRVVGISPGVARVRLHRARRRLREMLEGADGGDAPTGQSTTAARPQPERTELHLINKGIS
ncbi:MAG: sigma factor-like helix-turn-helix DNA-binding protein, partial [Pseudonocardiaceae bacterium]